MTRPIAIRVGVVYISLLLATGILFVNLYTSLVDAKSWSANIPQSIQTERDYYRVVNPGHFFRAFAPVLQVMALVALAMNWKSSPQIRLYLGIALLSFVLVDVLTFAYFYPRNKIMLSADLATELEVVRKAVAQWQAMNWVRTLIQLTGMSFSACALHRIYEKHQTVS